MQIDRRSEILETVMRDGKVSVADLCKRFDVTQMTIRRDLAELDRQGLLRKVHGGAVSAQGRSYEPPRHLRSLRSPDAKKAIALAAADLILEGDSIALDTGTTTFEIACALQGKRNLTIVTASLPIAMKLASIFSLDSDIRLILTGGIVRPGELSLVGQLSERTYHDLHVDKAFLGIGGLDLEYGLMEYNWEDAVVKQALLKTARQKILVTDSSKLGQITLASVAPLSVLDTVITDKDAPAEFLQALRRNGIEVIVAEDPSNGNDALKR
jgi:DeoR/GlpR family transcriptional regulator of sugar metabolism